MARLGSSALAAVLTLGFAASARAALFGLEPGSFSTELTGSQAGEHADLRATFTLAQEPPGDPVGYAKEINLSLPPGLVADPAATPACTMGEVLKEVCPAEAAVGVAEITTGSPPIFESPHENTVFVYNIKPYADEPAALAFISSSAPVRFDFSLRGPSYGLTMNATDVSDSKPLISAVVTLWGIPADHNGPECHINETTSKEECVKFGGRGSGPRSPFLSNPVQCSSSSPSDLAMGSWQGESFATELPGGVGTMDDCETLQFAPSVVVAPEKTQRTAPTGYEVAVKLPDNREPDGRAEADLRNASLQLPAGTVISPSAGNGLDACSQARFEPASAEASSSTLPAECQASTQIGSASIKTPLLAEPLTGQVFLGTPECGPCSDQDAQEGKMIRLLLQASGSGVLIKLKGAISVDLRNGRLTATIDGTPQLPVEELKLTLNGGSNALLANPAECSTSLQGSGSLTPYNTETPTEVSSAPFQLTGCGASQFAPAFNAGTVANQAGAASPAVVTITRSDQEQSLGRFTVRMPPGLLGLLSKVPACPSAVAQQGTCSSQSEIGSVAIAAGPGERPLSLSGKVFLTGPYAGAPFGLSIVTPAQAGPIDLGTIDIQAGIYVDPTTAALTIASGEVPQSLAGIPLQIRSLSLDIDRQGFIVDPTDCRPQAISADLASAQGTATSASQHYQVAGCAKLPFKPQLTALAAAKTTRLGGASVHLKLASGAGQANVSKVKIDLPKALPSRLTTLQGACREAVFKTNPANCPASSVLGTGAITTPFLRALMTGPVYMVSHGSRAFPDLDAVVEAEGVTLTLVGTTAFTNGISSEAFRTLPDAPISTLDLMFPASPHSAFAANANLCKRALPMPTELTGQNGAVVKPTVKIAVSGCPVKRGRLQRKGAKP
jgi:hypothetical protein